MTASLPLLLWPANQRTSPHVAAGLPERSDKLPCQVLDLASVVKIVKDAAPEARVVADGVAYAPHLPVDVAAWGVDWLVAGQTAWHACNRAVRDTEPRHERCCGCSNWDGPTLGRGLAPLTVSLVKCRLCLSVAVKSTNQVQRDRGCG